VTKIKNAGTLLTLQFVFYQFDTFIQVFGPAISIIGGHYRIDRVISQSQQHGGCTFFHTTCQGDK